MDLSGLLARHARYRGDHMALKFNDRHWSYGQLDIAVNRMANALLGLGLGKGDKLATILSNCPELVMLYWAASKTGIVVVPMSPLLSSEAIRGLLGACDAAAIVTDVASAETVDAALADADQIRPNRRLCLGADRPGMTSLGGLVQAAPASPPPDAAIAGEDIFNITFSSGTTGQPKGIMHSHQVRANYGTLFASIFRMTPESVVLHAGAIIFNGAFVTLMPSFCLGSAFVLGESFDAESFIETIERERVTHVMLVPTQIIALLNSTSFTPERVGSLECILSLGAPLHLEHKERLHRRLPGRFYELYGVTEGFMVILDKNDFERKPDSVGAPTPFFEVRIVDEGGRDKPAGEVGEIVGRSPLAMQGYYGRPDLTREVIKEGWIYSGDLGYLDEDGYVFLVDRKKDMIISGGVNVYPRDIEEVIARHSAVREVAVFGVPDERWGESPVAAVVVSPDAPPSDEELRAWINERVPARYQKVARVAIVKEFPRNAAGKILKRDLRDSFVAPGPKAPLERNPS